MSADDLPDGGLNAAAHGPAARRRAPRAVRGVRRGLHVAAGALALLLAACSSPFPYADPALPHHGPNGFVNPGVAAQPTPMWEAAWRRMRGDFQPAHEPEGGYAAFAARWRVPLEPAALATPPADGAPRLVWLGHAGTLLQVGGRTLLIDPHLTDYAGPLSWLASQRRVSAPIAPEALPPIDAVLITHNHYDHLDLPTLERLLASGHQRPHFYVPLGLKRWFDAQGIGPVDELDWWDARQLGDLTLRYLPAQHWSKRTLTDANQTLWGGWAVEWAGQGRAPWRFVHTGDTAFAPALYAEMRQRLGGGIDLLALPIGAYEPREFMRRQHTNPDEAVQLLQLLAPRQAFAIHWGVFELSNEPFDQPPRDLAEALTRHGEPAERVWLLRQGEVKDLP